jgi:hypothetical protein
MNSNDFDVVTFSLQLEIQKLKIAKLEQLRQQLYEQQKQLLILQEEQIQDQKLQLQLPQLTQEEDPQLLQLKSRSEIRKQIIKNFIKYSDELSNIINT